MSINNFLKKLNIENYKTANNKFNELKDQFIEMGQLKSRLDSEKFTIMSKGNFPAHQFHMLMRQYVLAQSEMRRMLLEKEKLERLIEYYSLKGKELIIIDGKENFADIYVDELINQLDLLEVTMVNKIMMCKDFEDLRKALINKNGGKEFTNEQYQLEEPEFWKWNLLNKAKNQASQAATGINEGIWEAIKQAESEAVLDKNFKLEILKNGNIDFSLLDEIEKNLCLPESLEKA